MRFKHDLLALITLTVLVTSFFVRLFFPTPQLLVTQDIGRSDAWHFSFATKFALSGSLKENSLPLWRSDIGNGFPLYAEGQTGALYLPNIILFKLFDPVTAYNLALTITMITLSIGIYILCRTFSVSTLGSWFAAATITFSAYPIMQLPHITLLQGTSLMPFAWAATIWLTKKGWWPAGYILIFVFTQQIFAGFPQATFISVLVCGAYALWHGATTKQWKPLLHLLLVLILTIPMAAAQLFPSYEFLKRSAFPEGFDYQRATLFSFPLADLATLVNPFAIGNPKTGHYVDSMISSGNIVWENTIFAGFAPLLFFIIGALFYRKKPFVSFLLLASLGALLLAWGKDSPLYLIYTMWPFNLFRVPSRFIWVTLVTIVIIAAIAWDKLYDRSKQSGIRHVLISLIIANTMHLYTTWWSYHLLVSAHDWLKPPPMVSRLVPGRVQTVAENSVQQKIYFNHGWVDPTPFYELRNGVSPNSNIFWDIPQQTAYAGRFLLRPSVIEALLGNQSIQTSETAATFSATTHTMLNMLSVTNVLSFVPLTHQGLIPTVVQEGSRINVWGYTNPNAIPRAHMVTHARVAETFQQAGAILQDASFNPRTEVLLETHEVAHNQTLEQFIKTAPSENPGEATIMHETHMAVVIQTQSSMDTILVLADTHYPGWEATIDGNQTPIFAANFSLKAVAVPYGSHTVIFSYKPKSVNIGIWTSGVSHLLIGVLALFGYLTGAVHIRKKVLRRQRRRVNNRGR